MVVLGDKMKNIRQIEGLPLKRIIFASEINVNTWLIKRNKMPGICYFCNIFIVVLH